MKNDNNSPNTGKKNPTPEGKEKKLTDKDTKRTFMDSLKRTMSLIEQREEAERRHKDMHNHVDNCIECQRRVLICQLKKK